MIKLFRLILGEEFLKKRRGELLKSLQLLHLKFFGLLGVILMPMVYFSVIPVTVNGVEYTGLEGAYYMALMLSVFLLVFPFVFYFLIETERD